jgi:hypothetical protein
VSAIAAIPGLPGAACPAAAAAMAATGLGPVCQVASAVSGAAGAAASQVAGAGVSSVLGDLGSWVAEGASWLLTQIGAVIGDTTSIDLGASWFGAHYGTMAGLAGVVIVPLLLLGIIQSVYRQNLSSLLRSVLVNVPLAILLTAVAVKLVQLGISVTDAMSTAVAHGAGLDTGHFMASVVADLSPTSATGQPSTPGFVLFLGSLAVVVGAVLVWIELLIRAAAVYVAVLFLPLALASLAWPAIAHWSRRLVDTLVALILGKFVIVSVLSLAAGALAGGTGSTPSGTTPDSGSGGGFTAVLGGAALLLLSACAPWALFRLLPFVEAGAVGHLEGLSHRARQTATVPVRGLAQTAMRMTATGAFASRGAAMAGGALGGSMAGGAAARAAGGSSGSGSGSGGGGDSRGGGGGGVPGGGGGSPGGGPDLGPSSVETTGVGTKEPPGHGIPLHDIHPEATAVANGYGTRDREEPGGVPGPTSWSGPSIPTDSGWKAGPVSSPDYAELQPLPRQSGAIWDDYLGRDRMGIKLVTRPMAPPDPPRGPGSAGG